MVEVALLGYYVVAIIYLIPILWLKSGARIADAALVIGLPFAGLPLSIVRLVASHMKSIHRHVDTFVTVEEDDDQDRPFFERINVDKERNRVPLEEALRINDMPTRRRLMLDALKDEMNEDVVPLLELAASNEDTETSHYAVTAAMEIKRKRMLDIQKHSVAYERDRTNLAAAESYVEAIRLYLASGFLDKRTQNGYKLTYAKLLGQLADSEDSREEWFGEKIRSEIELGNHEQALRYSRLYLLKYPGSEQAYIANLHLYYKMKQGDRFEETLQQLKASRIRVSNEGLNIIRYWSNKGA